MSQRFWKSPPNTGSVKTQNIKEFTYLGYKNKSCNVTGFHSCFLICNAKNYLYSKNYCIHRVRKSYFALSSPSSLANLIPWQILLPIKWKRNSSIRCSICSQFSTKTYLQEGDSCVREILNEQTHYFFSCMNSWSPIIEENLPTTFVRRTWHLVNQGPRGSPLLSMKTNQSKQSHCGQWACLHK